MSAIYLILALLSIGSIREEAAVTDEVDLIEINHFHDDKGRPVFDQLIYYEWSAYESQYQVIAWRMLKTDAQIPHRDWRNGGYVAVWHDSQTGNLLRKIKTQSIRTTWTQYDPELIEREFLAKEKRRELKQAPVTYFSSQAYKLKQAAETAIQTVVP